MIQTNLTYYSDFGIIRIFLIYYSDFGIMWKGLKMFLGIPVKYIFLYVLVINLIGFFVMWWDKRQAKMGNWRTPEKTLFMITLLRWWIRNNCGDV